MTINAEDELWTPPEDGTVEFEVQVIADDSYNKQVRCIAATLTPARTLLRPNSLHAPPGVLRPRHGHQRSYDQWQKSLARACGGA